MKERKNRGRGRLPQIIYIGNLPYSATVGTITKLLKLHRCFGVRNVRILPDPEGRSKGTAVVTLAFRGAERAMAEGLTLEGRRLTVGWAPTQGGGGMVEEPFKVPSVSARVAEAFAREWLQSAQPDEALDIMRGAPRLPKHLDAQLMRFAEHDFGSLESRETVRTALRRSFFATVRSMMDFLAQRRGGQ